MTRRRLLTVSALLLLPLIGVGVYWAIQPPIKPGVTLENFRRLHFGMNTKEIADILGEPNTPFRFNEVTRWKNGDNEIEIGFTCEVYAYAVLYAENGTFTSNHALVEKLAERPENVLSRCSRWVKHWTGW